MEVDSLNCSTEPPVSVVPENRSVGRDLLSGTGALAAGMVMERGLGFLANAWAARLAGSSVFGAYSVSLTTANNIAAYAAGGIGSTATRFSAQYAPDTPQYSAVSRALLVISLCSAAIAVGLLYGSAGVIAQVLLRNPPLAPLLRTASFCAGGMILLECWRGFLVGQRRLSLIVLLSAIVGFGMIGLMPVAARHGASWMIVTQAGVSMTAVCACLIFAGRRTRAGEKSIQSEAVGPMIRTIWGFGIVQLSGLILLNLAGWWLTSLVARSDTNLVQVGLFAVSHQLRNVVALAPAMLTESALGLMISRPGSHAHSSDRVLKLSTFASVSITLLCSGIGIITLPWLLPLIYGESFRPGVLAATVALATAVVHMGSAPAGARLTIVSIRAWGVVNAVWAAFVAVSATLFVTRGGAVPATIIYLAAHLISGTLTFLYLKHRAEAGSHTFGIYLQGCGVACLLVGLEILRLQDPIHAPAWTALMVVVVGIVSWLLFRMGRTLGLVPPWQAILAMGANLGLRFLPVRSGAGNTI